MEPLPIPNRCIWCLKTAPEATFDKSHVLPSCVGNHYQQVLPPGIVCKKCNGFFGSQVEPALLADPIFHVIAVFLAAVDPDDMNVFRNKIFDSEHPPVEQPVRSLYIHPKISSADITMAVKYSIEGKLAKTYKENDLKKLSRAVHKIAFESLAWTAFVKGPPGPVDLFSEPFNVVRAWAKEGQPRHLVRPVLRRPATTITHEWAVEVWTFGDDWRVQMNLFGDWYAVSLTAPWDIALTGLGSWAKDLPNAWCIAETMRKP